jgi:hypothetical protein
MYKWTLSCGQRVHFDCDVKGNELQDRISPWEPNWTLNSQRNCLRVVRLQACTIYRHVLFTGMYYSASPVQGPGQNVSEFECKLCFSFTVNYHDTDQVFDLASPRTQQASRSTVYAIWPPKSVSHCLEVATSPQAVSHLLQMQITSSKVFFSFIKQTNLFIGSLWVSHHAPQSHSHTKKRHRKHKMQCVTQFVLHYTPLCTHLANVHCFESLVWFEGSHFCDTINIGILSGLLLLWMLRSSFSFWSAGLAQWWVPVLRQMIKILGWASSALDLDDSWTGQHAGAFICTTSTSPARPPSVPVSRSQGRSALRTSGLVHLHPLVQSQLHCAAQLRIKEALSF